MIKINSKKMVLTTVKWGGVIILISIFSYLVFARLAITY